MKAYLGLGSNLGDRDEYLRQAIDAIPDRVDQSSVWETNPVGGPEGQGAFLNMVVALETERSPRELLELCRSLEEAAGRVRTERWGPRTLDVDVLLVGDLEVNEPDLVVPHPRLWERAFAVVPLVEVAPQYADRLDGLDTSGLRKAPSLWGDFDLSVRPADAARWFGDWDGPWAICGGWAIELFVGRSFREHHDLEVSVARNDLAQLHEVLPGWEFFIPRPGSFVRWPPGHLPAADGAHQIWGRPSPDAMWSVEIMFEDIRDGVLYYRRDPSVTLPLDEAILHTSDGIPYIAPQLQLLYKAKYSRPRDDEDFAAALPLLSDQQRAWLEEHRPS